MFRHRVGPERGRLQGDIDCAQVVVPSPAVFIPEHEADLIGHRLGIELKVKGGIPDGVERLAHHICRELVSANGQLYIRVRVSVLL